MTTLLIAFHLIEAVFILFFLCWALIIAHQVELNKQAINDAHRSSKRTLELLNGTSDLIDHVVETDGRLQEIAQRLIKAGI